MSRPQVKPGSKARRWPDVMIGALVVLLVGGFGTVLLRGGSESAPQGSAPAVTPTIPSAPGTEASAPATTETAAVSAGTETASPEAAAPVTAPPTEEAPVIEAAPIGQPDPALQTPVTQETPAPAGANTEAATEEDGATPTTTPAPRTGGAVAASEQRVPLRSDYRISLGTFGSEEGARSAAAGVSALGYTVYPIDLGTQVVAQLGPFSDETSARQALADIQRAYPSAVLYPPRGRSLTGVTATTPEAATPTTSAPATTTPETAAPAPQATTPAPAPDGPTYLQVGAFDRVESAQNLVQQLRDLGYAPTVSAPEGRKVTVLVGPYTGDALGRTEGRLNDNGLDSFRVR
ncbi:hypothetical protein GO986_19675 [Deinococcus sp. HMF7620]|uniref:SPOR domain-containing protein n=1 Tax=Deinococcus arboris TaxID=2682977 RepID=A0A7C9M8X4_9DEIO|nr:hypothetical protein [Deinococcus arboris]